MNRRRIRAVWWSRVRLGPVVPVVSVAGLLLLAACSGDDDTTSPTVASVVPVVTSEAPSSTAAPSTVASITAPPPTSTPAATTVAPTTSEPVDTTSPTTAPPPTTGGDTTTTTLPEGVPPRVTFPDDPEAQAVVDAIYRHYDALLAAESRPDDQGLLNSLLDTVAPGIQEGVRGYVLGLADAGRSVRQDPDDPPVLDLFAFTVETIGGSASADGCVAGTATVVSIDPQTGVESEVNTQSGSLLNTYGATRSDDGVWRVSSVENVARFPESATCE